MKKSVFLKNAKLLALFVMVCSFFIGCSNDDNAIDETSDTYTPVSDDKDPYEQNIQLYLEYSDWLDSIGNTLMRAEFSYNYRHVDTDYDLFGTCHVKNGRIISHEESPSVNGTAVPVYDRLKDLFEDFKDSWSFHIYKNDEFSTLWYGEITYDEFNGVRIPQTLICYKSVENSYGKSPYYEKYEITDIKLSK